MARLKDRHPGGAPGDWFVDTRCIDCDAARHVAPGLIERNPGDGVSLFVRQPETDDPKHVSYMTAQFSPWFDWDVSPVLDVADSAATYGEALAWAKAALD